LPGRPAVNMNELHAELQRYVPVLRAKADDISILDKPSDFYNLIIQKIFDSQKQICLSSLYIGTDTLSKEIVHFLLHSFNDF
jgi:phosphatidylserine/phosphatidylglycerophosphate/cardiolipin synthase-like enzyme